MTFTIDDEDDLDSLRKFCHAIDAASNKLFEDPSATIADAVAIMRPLAWVEAMSQTVNDIEQCDHPRVILARMLMNWAESLRHNAGLSMID